MSDTILAIDLGRYKSVACVYSRPTREHSFRTVDSTPDGIARLLARHPAAVVLIEACANAGWWTPASRRCRPSARACGSW